MKSMFISALETAFDKFFMKRNPCAELSDPHTNSDYREELEAFAKFLVEEYEHSVVDTDYWERRFSK